MFRKQYSQIWRGLSFSRPLRKPIGPGSSFNIRTYIFIVSLPRERSMTGEIRPLRRFPPVA